MSRERVVWIVVNGCHGLREADTPSDRKIYPMFFSTKPTVYHSYKDARNAKRRQARGIRRMMRPDKLYGMGRGFKEKLRQWIRELNVIRVGEKE
jgi:hypothetical protein